MNGGYMMIDCKKLDLTKTAATQEIPGLYAECMKAFTYNKPIQAYNCVYGSVGKVSPIPVFATIPETGKLCLTASVLQVFVDSDDVVTINSMIAG